MGTLIHSKNWLFLHCHFRLPILPFPLFLLLSLPKKALSIQYRHSVGYQQCYVDKEFS